MLLIMWFPTWFLINILYITKTSFDYIDDIQLSCRFPTRFLINILYINILSLSKCLIELGNSDAHAVNDYHKSILGNFNFPPT